MGEDGVELDEEEVQFNEDINNLASKLMNVVDGECPIVVQLALIDTLDDVVAQYIDDIEYIDLTINNLKNYINFLEDINCQTKH